MCGGGGQPGTTTGGGEASSYFLFCLLLSIGCDGGALGHFVHDDFAPMP